MATTQQQQQPFDSNTSSGVDSEKQSVQYVEDQDMAKEIEETGYVRTYADIDEGFDPKEVKRVVRKVDLHLIPILAAMYCISLIDRTNLSMARSANGKIMNRELSLDQGNYYSVATMVSHLSFPLSQRFESPPSFSFSMHSLTLLLDILYPIHCSRDSFANRAEKVRRAVVACDGSCAVGHRDALYGFRQDSAAADRDARAARYL